jgi:hypothetical protein
VKIVKSRVCDGNVESRDCIANWEGFREAREARRLKPAATRWDCPENEQNGVLLCAGRGAVFIIIAPAKGWAGTRECALVLSEVIRNSLNGSEVLVNHGGLRRLGNDGEKWERKQEDQEDF